MVLLTRSDIKQWLHFSCQVRFLNVVNVRLAAQIILIFTRSIGALILKFPASAPASAFPDGNHRQYPQHNSKSGQDSRKMLL